VTESIVIENMNKSTWIKYSWTLT